MERDGTNVVLEFDPQPRQDTLLAGLWSRWTAPDNPDSLSFAAIADEPPLRANAALATILNQLRKKTIPTASEVPRL